MEDILHKANRDFLTSLAPTLAYLVLLMVFGMVGNTVVFLVYYKRFKFSVTRTYILVLSVCDLVNNCVAIPSDINEIRFNYTFYDDAACKLFGALIMFVSLLEALILVAIALDRQRTICQLRGKPRTLTNVWIELICLGVLALSIAVPFGELKGLQTVPIPNSTINGTTCGINEKYKDSLLLTIDHAALSTIFMVSVVIMGVCYALIARHLYLHKKRLHLNAQKRHQQSLQPHMEIHECAEDKHDEGVQLPPVAGTGHPHDCTQHAVDCTQHAVDCKQHAVDRKQHAVDRTQLAVESPAVQQGSLTPLHHQRDEETVTGLKTQPEESASEVNSQSIEDDDVGKIFLGKLLMSSTNNSANVVKGKCSEDKEDEATPAQVQVIITDCVEQNHVMDMDQTGGTVPSPLNGVPERKTSSQQTSTGDITMEDITTQNTSGSVTAPTRSPDPNATSQENLTKVCKAKAHKKPHKVHYAHVKRMPNRTTLTLFVMTVVFIVSYLPYLVISAGSSSSQGQGSFQVSALWRNLHKIASRSYFINSAVNPLIYSFCSVHFRRECYMFLCLE